MMTEKIFVLLVLVVASHIAYSKGESLRGHGVFLHEREWLTLYRREHSVNSQNNSPDAANYKVCETQECKRVAVEFLSSMNKSMDPCEDFYEFACGGWSAKDLPPYLPVWSRFMIFNIAAKYRIKGVLETAPEPSDILPIRQAKKWYRSCMDLESLDKRGVTPIESIVMQVGGWPITMDKEEWDSEEYTWQRVERHYVRTTGSLAFFKIKISPATILSRHCNLVIEPREMTLGEQLPLSYRNYKGNDYDAYVRLVESAAALFLKHNRANVSKEKLSKEAKEIVEFEKALYELVSEGNTLRLSPDDLEVWYDNTDSMAKVDLPPVIQVLFDTMNMELDEYTDMCTTFPAYIKGLSKLLKKTPARTIVNYIHWTFVGNMLMYTTEEVRNELLAFAWQEFGVTERPPRWYECVSDMKMTDTAAYVFVDKYFPKSTENAARAVIKNIQKEMEEEIENSIWLDAESKNIMKNKLNSIEIFLGFPDWYKNRTAVINHYKGITVGAEYFDNILRYKRYTQKNELKQYLTSENQEESYSWRMDPITANAFYGRQQNTLTLPAANFQAPLFTQHLPDAVNYGIAGILVGHEMGHAFDDSSFKYGKNGKGVGLSDKMLNSYDQRADCFTNQFDEYYSEERTSESSLLKQKLALKTKGENIADTTGIQAVLQAYQKLNKQGSSSRPPGLEEYTNHRLFFGSLDFLFEKSKALKTRGENIADTTGIQAVFQAYQKLDKQGSSLRLPGLEEYTNDQLFFLSFAAMWCKVETPQYEKKNELVDDRHSPARLRVIGAVSNTNDFAKVFNCPKGSKMNPRKKCNIWG